MHIFMSYCSYSALKILLKNYLGFDEGDLDGAVLQELEGVVDKAEMTPADVSEVLIKNRRDKEKAVRELLKALKVRADRNAKNGGLSRERDVEEEQEKRALETPRQGCEFQEESCRKEKGNEERDDGKIEK